MTHSNGPFVEIERLPDAHCELCGALAELRPYGPKGEQICHPCGKKNPEATRAAFLKLLEGADAVRVHLPGIPTGRA